MFLDLFEKHREQYYCALIMTESACPCISAMSYEVLEQILDKKYDCKDEKEIDINGHMEILHILDISMIFIFKRLMNYLKWILMIRKYRIVNIVIE